MRSRITTILAGAATAVAMIFGVSTAWATPIGTNATFCIASKVNLNGATPLGNAKFCNKVYKTVKITGPAQEQDSRPFFAGTSGARFTINVAKNHQVNWAVVPGGGKTKKVPRFNGFEWDVVMAVFDLKWKDDPTGMISDFYLDVGSTPRNNIATHKLFWGDHYLAVALKFKTGTITNKSILLKTKFVPHAKVPEPGSVALLGLGLLVLALIGRRRVRLPSIRFARRRLAV